MGFHEALVAFCAVRGYVSGAFGDVKVCFWM